MSNVEQPTPEALEAAIDHIWPHYTDSVAPKMEYARRSRACTELALLLDRFAAQRAAEAMERERVEIRRLRDAIISARWRLAKGRALWNGPCHQCDAALERGLTGKDIRDQASNLELAALDAATPPPRDAGRPMHFGTPGHVEFHPAATTGDAEMEEEARRFDDNLDAQLDKFEEAVTVMSTPGDAGERAREPIPQEAAQALLPFAERAQQTVETWWSIKTNGAVLDPDLVAVIGQAAFSALQRYYREAQSERAAAASQARRETALAEKVIEAARGYVNRPHPDLTATSRNGSGTPSPNTTAPSPPPQGRDK